MAYSSYPEITEKWHVASGAGLNGCIKRTVDDLNSFETLRFFVVKDGIKFVGYFGIEFDGKYMPTIFISPEYRKNKSLFWSEVKNKMNPIFRAGIYSKNIPCLKFYSKLGKKISEISTPDGQATIFEFKRSA